MAQFYYRITLVFVLLVTPSIGIRANVLDDGIQAYDRQDYLGAYKQLLPLAEQGNGEAQYYVGGMLVDGIGIPSDTSRGVYWLEQAVNNQYYMAAQMLGSMYLSGLGVPMDPQKGAKYIMLYEKQAPKDEVDSGCD